MRCLYSETDPDSGHGNESVGIGKGMRAFLSDTDYILKGRCVLTQYLFRMLDAPDHSRVMVMRALLRSVVYLVG